MSENDVIDTTANETTAVWFYDGSIAKQNSHTDPLASIYGYRE